MEAPAGGAVGDLPEGGSGCNGARLLRWEWIIAPAFDGAREVRGASQSGLGADATLSTSNRCATARGHRTSVGVSIYLARGPILSRPSHPQHLPKVPKPRLSGVAPKCKCRVPAK